MSLSQGTEPSGSSQRELPEVRREPLPEEMDLDLQEMPFHGEAAEFDEDLGVQVDFPGDEDLDAPPPPSDIDGPFPTTVRIASHGRSPRCDHTRWSSIKMAGSSKGC